MLVLRVTLAADQVQYRGRGIGGAKARLAGQKAGATASNTSVHATLARCAHSLALRDTRSAALARGSGVS